MTILLFGVTRDIVGTGSLSLRETEGLKTVADLKRQMMAEFPALGELSSLAVAVNQSYAREDDLINVTDEIALIPPVSGG